MADLFLMGLHVFFADLVMFGYVWLFAELLGSIDESRLSRIKLLALATLIGMIITWISAGYYYVYMYGADKAIIKQSETWAWAHGIVMETKEHIFYLAPLLAFLIYLLVNVYGPELKENREARFAIMALSIVMIIGGLVLIDMGSTISFGYREALGEKLAGFIMGL